MSDPLTEKVIGAAIEVHCLLGPGLLESILRGSIVCGVRFRRIAFERQVELDVNYKGHVIKGQRVDLLVEKDLVVELKSVSSLPEVATAQVLSYLKAGGLKRALLLNFGAPRLVDGIKRISL